MKKSIVKFFVTLLIFSVMSLPVYSNLYAVEPVNEVPAPKTSKILEARFLNMLNHNYVYNDSFNNINDIVNDSVVALLQHRDAEDDSYISQEVVNCYLTDMFGFEVFDFSEINSEFPKKEGFVYIVPKGFYEYKHKPVSITENEDGTYTFITKVTITSHDNFSVEKECKTMFAENDDSAFGFNIVKSQYVDFKTLL